MIDSEYLLIQGLMAQLRVELQRLNLWSGEPPVATVMPSELACSPDAMSLHEWLERVFLPQLETMLDTGEPLPAKSDISSYAETVLPAQQNARDIGDLLSILRLLDEAIAS